MKKFNNFEKVEEANLIKNVRNRIKNFDKFGPGGMGKKRKDEVKGLLKRLALNNRGVELVDGGVNISTGKSVYYLGLDGEVRFPYDSSLYLDVDDAKEIYNDILNNRPSPPRPTPSNDPSFTEDTPDFENKIRRMGKAPKKEPTFPCVYSFITQELFDRKRAKGQKVIGIRPDGYSFFCETPEDLENYKHVYRSGEKYKGETITGTNVGPPQN